MEVKSFNVGAIGDESKVWVRGEAPFQIELISRGERRLEDERVKLKTSCMELARRVSFLQNQAKELGPPPFLASASAVTVGAKEEEGALEGGGVGEGGEGGVKLEDKGGISHDESAYEPPHEPPNEPPHEPPPASSAAEVIDLSLMDDNNDHPEKKTQLEIEMDLFQAREARGGNQSSVAGPSSSSAAPSSAQSQCSICFTELSGGVEVVLFPCAHFVCNKCTTRLFEKAKLAPCPICRQITDSKELVKTKLAATDKSSSTIPLSGANLKGGRYGEVEPPEGPSLLSIPPPNFSFLTKVDALVRRISWLNIHCPDEKSLVFSQWREALSLVSKALTQQGIKHTSLSGGGGAKGGVLAKEALISFNEDEECKVMLLSLQTQAAGLTLVRASRVFLLEPATDPSIEQQAVARVHRVGQERETVITRLIIEETIEEKVLQMLERKQRLLGDPDIRADEEGGEGGRDLEGVAGTETERATSARAHLSRNEVVNEGDARGLLSSLLDNQMVEI